MIKINIGWWFGFIIAMIVSYKIWGSNGMWFTFGLSLQSSKIFLTLGRNKL